MPRQHQLDARAAQRLDDVEILLPGHAEDVLDALVLQRCHQQVGSFGHGRVSPELLTAARRLTACAKSWVEAVPPRSRVRTLSSFSTALMAPRRRACQVDVPDMVQHQPCGQQQGSGIRDGLAGDVRRRAMHCLEDRALLADVGTRRGSQPAYQSRDQIREDVAEQVGRHDHVELPWVQHELHRAGIDDAVIEGDPALVLLGNLARGLEEDAGQRLQHVGLVDDGDLLAAELQCVVEGEARYPPRSLPRVDARRDSHRMRVVADGDVVFEGDVETLQVLPDQHEVDVLESPTRHQRVRRAQVGVEVEFFAQAHVDGAEAAADRGGERPLEG